jgi:hypothetical protein
MPTPVKPCDGQLSDDLQAVLTRNRDREQWAVYPCQSCGASVGAVQVHGKWVPEQHWPSVVYPRRTGPIKKHSRTAPPQEDAVPASSSSR